jgi:hypothetical protein
MPRAHTDIIVTPDRLGSVRATLCAVGRRASISCCSQSGCVPRAAWTKAACHYKHILKLYNQRSAAAHTASEIDQQPLIASWVLLRNALMKMIVESHVPSQADFEQILFADESIADSAAVSWGAWAAQDDNG